MKKTLQAEQRLSHPNSSRRFPQLVHSCSHLIPKVQTIRKVVTSRVDESRYDDAAEVEHQTIRQSHYRHVTGRSAGCTQKTNHFVFPRVPGELHQILGRRIYVEIIDRRCHNNYTGRVQKSLAGLHVGVSVGGVRVAKRKLDLPQIEQLAVQFRLSIVGNELSGQGSA